MQAGYDAWPLLAHRCSTVKPFSQACASYQYPSWVPSHLALVCILCCLTCFANVTCCLYCLTCFTNVDVRLSVPLLGPFSIFALCAFMLSDILHQCYLLFMSFDIVSAFGCIQTAGSTVVPNSKKMLPIGQLSPSPDRGTMRRAAVGLPWGRISRVRAVSPTRG